MPPSTQRDALGPAVEWLTALAPIGYEEAVAVMDARVSAIAKGSEAECVWSLEHPALYTAGTSADAAEILKPDRFPVFKSGRGGRYTYHGPGQRVVYVMLDLEARGRDIRAYVTGLEDCLIATLNAFGIEGARRPGTVGIFVADAKIASIGVRVRRWVSLHGFSLNVDPDLEHFSGIVPCGLTGTEVTSLKKLGADTDLTRVDAALRKSFDGVFGTGAG